MRNIENIIIHCSASSFGNAHRIRNWHLERGWSDIGYHYVINNGKVFIADKIGEHIENGLIEEGRPLEKAGAHCKGHNSNSIGICLIGEDHFSDEQYTSLETLLLGLMEQFNIGIDDIKGHKDFTSHKTCPNFNIDKFKQLHLLGE